MRKTLFLTVLFALILSLSNRINAQREIVGEAVTFRDTTWYDRGFDVYVGGGIFFGSPKNALYYNGSVKNECNLNYIFDNTDRLKEIQGAVNKVYPHIGMGDEISFKEENLNGSPHYNPSVLVGLGIRWKIRNNWGISLSYSFARMTLTDRFLLSHTSVSGNTAREPEMTLAAKEDRSHIDLSLSYLFSQTHRIVKPFVEVGVQFNYQKLKDFNALILDYKRNNAEVLKLSLIDRYGGANYIPGVEQYDNGYIFGGPGFGVAFSAGIKFVVNKYVSIDPTFYGSYSYYNLKPLGDRQMTFNYGAMVRIVMNDFFFQNNR